MSNRACDAASFGLGLAIGIAASAIFRVVRGRRDEAEDTEECGEPDNAEQEEEKREESQAQADYGPEEYRGLTENLKQYFEDDPDIDVIASQEMWGLDYDVVTLRCFADGTVVEDTYGQVVESPEDEVGRAALRLIRGQDSVFVRNDKSMTCYELVRDVRTFPQWRGDDDDEGSGL